MKKSILISASVALLLLLVCLVPHASHRVNAYPENLWTSSGNFSNPTTTREVLEWDRTEYGVFWTWLVRDGCTSEPAWYLRAEPRYLTLYVGVAVVAGIAAFFLIGRGTKQG